MLDGVDFELIDNTVIRIPVKVPLVSVLQKYIKGRGMVHASHNKQLKAVLRLLCSADHPQRVPGCQNLLTLVYAILETRTQHYNQVLQLRGMLELLTRQAMDRQGDTVVVTESKIS